MQLGLVPQNADALHPGARIDTAGEVQLVNHLRVKPGNEPEQTLDRLYHDALTEADIDDTTDRVVSDHHYAHDVRDIDADAPNRPGVSWLPLTATRRQSHLGYASLCPRSTFLSILCSQTGTPRQP
jgi:hypothetical protein